MKNVTFKEEAGRELEGIMRSHVPDVAPGMVAAVGVGDETVFLHSLGQIKDPEFSFRANTIFDMASLTKPIVTTTLMMRMLDRGKVALEDTMSSLGLFKSADGPGQLTVRSLLTHSSGLIWHYPLFTFGRDRESYMRGISAFGSAARIYSREEYSDLNFMTLAFLLEHLSGKKLDILAREEIFEPLGMKNSSFNPEKSLDEIAPTEITSERGLVWGKVHDENSYYLGGVAGHAGLFSNAEDVSKFVTGLLSGRLISRKTFELMVQPANNYLGGIFGLGWMIKQPRPAKPSESFGFSNFMGDYADFGTIGHTGFTGTSLVIDYRRKVWVTILSNRVFPTRENMGILRFRRLFHNAVFRNLE